MGSNSLQVDTKSNTSAWSVYMIQINDLRTSGFQSLNTFDAYDIKKHYIT